MLFVSLEASFFIMNRWHPNEPIFSHHSTQKKGVQQYYNCNLWPTSSGSIDGCIPSNHLVNKIITNECNVVVKIIAYKVGLGRPS
jgi:hypothetical protein